MLFAVTVTCLLELLTCLVIEMYSTEKQCTKRSVWLLLPCHWWSLRDI